MKNKLQSLATMLFISFAAFGQHQSLTELQTKTEYENISNRKIFTDSLASSFVIWVKKEVKPHKHLSHSEHVYILEGEAEMNLGNEIFPVKTGDLVFLNGVESLVVSRL